jgi:hypothetical protein
MGKPNIQINFPHLWPAEKENVFDINMIKFDWKINGMSREIY